VLYIKAGAAKMAGAWFIHRPVWPMRPVRALYRPVVNECILTFFCKRSTVLASKWIYDKSVCHRWAGGVGTTEGRHLDVTIHWGQISLLPSAGLEMSTSQSVVTLYSRGLLFRNTREMQFNQHKYFKNVTSDNITRSECAEFNCFNTKDRNWLSAHAVTGAVLYVHRLM